MKENLEENVGEVPIWSQFVVILMHSVICLTTVHSLFQTELYAVCYIALALSISTILSFSQGQPEGA